MYRTWPKANSIKIIKGCSISFLLLLCCLTLSQAAIGLSKTEDTAEADETADQGEIKNPETQSFEILRRLRSESYEEIWNQTQHAIDERQSRVTDRLFLFSYHVDRFFSATDYEQDYSESRMRVSFSNTIQRHSSPTYRPRLNLSLALPNTKEKLKLVLTSAEENNDLNDSSGIAEETANTSVSSALGLVVLASELIDIRADVGIRFDTPLDTFTRVKFRKSFQPLYNWDLRVTETFSWRKTKGKTASTRLNMERPLSDTLFFRSTSNITYKDINSYWSASQNLALFQKLNKKAVLAYSIGAKGQNEPRHHEFRASQVNEYWTEIRYRKNFYRNWLFYECAPGLLFPHLSDETPPGPDYKPTPRISLKIETVFGNI